MQKKILSTLKVSGLILVLAIFVALGWLGSVIYGLDKLEEMPVRKANKATERHITTGSIVGFSASDNMHVWSGIPFAKPVSGKHRWTMPTSPDPWTGTREMLKQAPFCPQFSFDQASIPEKGFIGEEDCLTLDVYAPALNKEQIATAEQKLPVMFWIHGGGNTLGAAGDLTRNKLVNDGNVILVTTQYRLGPLGFFSHEAIRSAGVQTANFGLEDQILALKWVQENISAFGGDPENVTIFGESAGGVNIFSLILSERATGLFHKTIIQSGSSTSTPRWQAENSLEDEMPGRFNNSTDIIEKWFIKAGIATDRQEAIARISAMTPEELLESMRDIPTLDLLQVYPKGPNDAMYPIPAAIRDGFTIPDEDPETLILTENRFNSTPGIFGTNRDEMGWAFLFNKDVTPRNTLGIPTLDNPEPRDAIIRYTSDIWKYIGADRPARWLHKTGEKNVFVYRFDWDEEPTYLGRDLGKYVGAAHAYDIPFVFGQFRGNPLPRYFLTKENAPGREALSSTMRKYWAAFAHTGTPGTGITGDQPQWQNWTPDTQKETMFLDTPADGGPKMAHARVSANKIKASFDTDPSLDDFGKCAVANFLVAAAEWTRNDLKAYKGGTCVIP